MIISNQEKWEKLLKENNEIVREVGVKVVRKVMQNQGIRVILFHLTIFCPFWGGGRNEKTFASEPLSSTTKPVINMTSQ